MTHLWEVNHPYYMNEGNYYKAGEHTSFKSIDDFLAEWGNADHDMNRVHRWDWEEGENKDGRGLFSVFFVLQRKARLLSCDVDVHRSDESRVKEYLLPYAELESRLWMPFMDPRDVKG